MTIVSRTLPMARSLQLRKLADCDAATEEGAVNSMNKSINLSSETAESQRSQAGFVEKRQHPRGTLIESLMDVTYKVLREYEHAV
jgi:hypothetical protein